ncbi:MAG: TrmH family RNA methyltransferase [Acidobacteria bacterium]|nr:TrmH family RNA methyltransferase [Acidobacteriota bacterium]
MLLYDRSADAGRTVFAASDAGQWGVGLITKEEFDHKRRLARRARRRDHYRRGLRSLAIAGWNTSKEHNVGTLVRTAHAVAAEEVVLVGDRDWNVEAAKTSEYFTDVTILEDETALLDHVRKRGWSLVAVELDSRAVSLFDAEYPENPCFLLGAERDGLPRSLIDAAEIVVQIPQWGLVPCLNLAVAGSIVLYDYLAKQQQKGALDRPEGGLVPLEDS